jgi:hypothetical protein
VDPTFLKAALSTIEKTSKVADAAKIPGFCQHDAVVPSSTGFSSLLLGSKRHPTLKAKAGEIGQGDYRAPEIEGTLEIMRGDTAYGWPFQLTPPCHPHLKIPGICLISPAWGRGGTSFYCLPML